MPSPSVAYLERTGQLRDLDFILAHVDDLPAVFLLENERIVMRGTVEQRGLARHPLPPAIGPASA